MESNKCCVCLAPLDAPGQGTQVLPCKHVLHESCVLQMRLFGTSRSCPLCRTESSDLTPVQHLLELTCLAYHRRLYPRCIQLLSEVLAIDPENGLGNFWLGQFYQFGHGVLEDYKRAAELYETARSAGKFDWNESALRECEKVANNLGEVYKCLGKLKEAEEMFWEAHHSGDSSGTFNLAYMCQERGDEKQAIELYFQARERGGYGGAVSSFNLANKYFRTGKLKEAISLYWQAYRNGYENWLRNLVIALLQDGQTVEVSKAIYLGLLSRQRSVALSLMHWMRSQGSDGGIPMWSTVRIHGLKSSNGEALNGLICPVWGYDSSSGRFCIIVENANKWIKGSNLTVESVWLDTPQSHVFDFALDQAIQQTWKMRASPGAIAAEGESISNSDETDICADKNASLMEALLHSRPNTQSSQVIVLKYSRNPECFHLLLQSAPELQEMRQELESNGLPLRLQSGAYIFVDTLQHGPLQEHIVEHNIELGPSHILVSEANEQMVVQCLASLPRKYKILMQSRRPIGGSNLDTSLKLPPRSGTQGDLVDIVPSDASDVVVVQRTFIHLPLPSSLRSMPSSGPRTSSTTDANPRFGVNPRRAATKQ